jgi:hypothetical protein
MSTLKVKFISTVFLKENTVIQDNVDDSTLVPFIYLSQDTNLQTAVGTTLYNRLKEGVALNNLNQNEEDLLRDYIQPMVAQWTFYNVYPFLNYKSTNKAISKESSEFSNPAELDEIKYMRNSIRDLAEFYTRRLNTFLCDYSNLFPEYENPDPLENLPHNSKSYFSGVYTQRRGYTDLFPNAPTYYGDRWWGCNDCYGRGC